MKRSSSLLLTAPFLLVFASFAAAQDPAPVKKKPNTLLLVDTSGSMEYKTGSTAFPTCDPTGVVASERSRWIELVEILTGSIADYRCDKVLRSDPSSSFAGDYTLNSELPIDAGYRNPYHRPLSGSCGYFPNTAAMDAAYMANAYKWVPPKTGNYSTKASCDFTSAGDGLLSGFTDLMRFGLMTFDTLPQSDRGYNAAGYAADFKSGIRGAWSYYIGQAAQGRPAQCPDKEDVEVGARNGTAPAWEGKMIPFGNPDATITDDLDRHDRIAKVLLSSRPYGATPIAGMLSDARDFLWNDTSEDPLDSGNATKSFGPYKDGYVQGECRDQSIILLTDGEPNLELRPACEGTDGICPYKKSEDIALDLAKGGTRPGVKTYVVGFAKATGGEGTDCTTMTPTDWAPGGKCTTSNDEALQVCCQLHKIANAGDTGKAYFADNTTDLKSALSKIFVAISNQGTFSATQPVSSNGVGAFDASPSTSKSVAFRILTSYTPVSDSAGTGDGNLFRGNVERMRWVCDKGVPKEQPKDPAAGDDFGVTLANNKQSRNFLSFLVDPSSGDRDSTQTIRPNLSTSVKDGAGTLTGKKIYGLGEAFVSEVLSDAMNISPSLKAPAAGCDGLSDDDCRTRVLKWALGYDNGTKYSRCNSKNCSVLGDILHSTPVIVDRPSSGIPDETYTKFANDNSTRPMMVYTSSNDGFLHGFLLSANADVDKVSTLTAPNESFAFIPPAVLTTIASQYPNSHRKLLDGAATVRDVAAEKDTGSGSPDAYEWRLQRDANGVNDNSSSFRTILLQAFGGANRGYFALDITDPKVGGSASIGPKFLWQLTKDAAGNPLFGDNPGRPLIATLLINGKEVAVAILPGGYGGAPLGLGSTGLGCSRKGSGVYSSVDAAYQPSATVRCYDDVAIPARSLTIVRLDSGEIIRTFRQLKTEVHSDMQNLVAESDLDAPIVGAPAAYPYLPGSVSDRIFIGDAEGTMWRVDVRSPKPEDWTMNIFFDAYATVASSPGLRRPIITAPTLSVDTRGQVTVAFATGDQDLSGTSGDRQYVWSVTETVASDGTGLKPFRSIANWYDELKDGEHAIGAFQLTGQVLYYATYSPSTNKVADPCGIGSSVIYGVNYLKPGVDGNGNPQVGTGGLAALRLGTATTAVKSVNPAALNLSAKDTLIFGVSVEFVPTCDDSAQGDSFIPGGVHNAVTSMSPPRMQLVFQTGTTKTSNAGLGFATGFETVDVALPETASTTESWASILD